MHADALIVAVMNEKSEYDSFVAGLRIIRNTIDRAAERVAKENAAWHDDPEADDHAAYHAPASEQFPRAVRDEAALELVRHYLAEMAISEANKGVTE